LIAVFEGARRSVGLAKLKQKAKQLYEEFDEKYSFTRPRDSGFGL